ncbi:MAG: hypothetical protein ACRDLF_10155 [Solirubrobacteraceae bacterium]
MTAARVLFPLAAILRWASRVICLIVIASFVIFAVGQTSSASTRQQEELNGTSTAATRPSHKSAAHKAIEEAAGKLTSPFSGITAGANSQWMVRGVGTLMALLVYGAGLGYLARVLRIRV